MNKTAIEHLFVKLYDYVHNSHKQEFINILSEVKQIEKQQIMNAFYKGIQEQTARVLINAKKTTPEQYYEQTFLYK